MHMIGIISTMRLPEPFDRLEDRAIRVLSVGRDDTVFRRDDPTVAIYFVEAGRVELRRYLPSGALAVLHRAGPGDFFAEAALFSVSYHCDAVASKDSRLFRIARAALLDRMGNDAQFCFELCGRFARQVQAYRRKVEILAIESAEDRVYAAFAEGLMGGSIKSFAGEIGLSHEAVYRALAGLARKGLVLKTGRGMFALPEPK